jgi:hypothetical protein
MPSSCARRPPCGPVQPVPKHCREYRKARDKSHIEAHPGHGRFEPAVPQHAGRKVVDVYELIEGCGIGLHAFSLYNLSSYRRGQFNREVSGFAGRALSLREPSRKTARPFG